MSKSITKSDAFRNFEKTVKITSELKSIRIMQKFLSRREARLQKKLREMHGN